MIVRMSQSAHSEAEEDIPVSSYMPTGTTLLYLNTAHTNSLN